MYDSPLLLPFACLLVAVFVHAGHAETPEELIKQGETALADGQGEKALAIARKAVDQQPTSVPARLLLGKCHEQLGRHAEAIAVFENVIAADPKAAEAYDHLGSEQFKLGQIAQSIASFDKYLELRPERTPHHWKRGISYYYAGRFDEGAKQFEGYQKVDSNDVENAVWRYLCMARTVGVDKSRADLLKIGNDKRVPMMEVYALFSAKSKPEDVLAAVRAGKPSEEELRSRTFMANLYLGLYYEAAGEGKKALEYLTRAAADAEVGGYMGDVARVHVELRKKEAKEN